MAPFDVSTLLTPGFHLLAIRVDNPEWGAGTNFRHRIVPDGCDFFNYGGIEREIWLEVSPKPSIVRVDVHQGDYTTVDHLISSQMITLDIVLKCPTVSVNGEFDPLLIECTLSIGIFPLNFLDLASLQARNTWNYIQWSENQTMNITQEVSLHDISGTGYIAHRIPMYLPNIRFWSTKHPNLYAVVVNISAPGLLDTDSYCTQIGFRHIDITKSNIGFCMCFLT